MSEKTRRLFLGIIDLSQESPSLACRTRPWPTFASAFARELVGLGPCLGCGLCDRPLSRRLGVPLNAIAAAVCPQARTSASKRNSASDVPALNSKSSELGFSADRH